MPTSSASGGESLGRAVGLILAVGANIDPEAIIDRINSDSLLFKLSTTTICTTSHSDARVRYLNDP